MKYFIDFEATQFSEEIISIGCVREDGETFYSLVAPVEGKITPFITNLTGITAEMIAEATNPTAVFEEFYDWVFAKDDIPDFYTWGDADISFLRHTFKRTMSYKSRMIIGYMCGAIRDYQKIFCKRISFSNLKLIKAYKSLIDENAEQNHNALDDAMMLFQIYNKASEYSVSELKEKFKEYKIAVSAAPVVEKRKWTQCGLPSGTICMVTNKGYLIKSFENVKQAILWIKEEKGLSRFVTDEQAEDKLKVRLANGKPYFGFKWRIIK